MKKYSYFVFALLLAAFTNPKADAQVIDNNPNKDVSTVQLTIMIVPFRTEGQEYRTLYDHSKATQYAIDKLKEGFDEKGYQVIDFVTAYDNAVSDHVIQGITNQDDVLSAIARHANADIMITVDISLQKMDLGNKAVVRLNASDASTNYSYGTKVCEPDNVFSTQDSLALIRRAMEDPGHPAVPEFLAKLQNAFTGILQKGRSLKIVLGFGKNSMYTFSSKMPSGDMLSVAINNWMKTAAYKNYSQMQSTTNISMIYSDVRVPIKDSQGMNYSPFDFGSKITAFLTSNKLKVDQPFMKSGALYVTIN
jgi:hypothetical protein